ncbi:MAG TPA: HAMP domain-containing methyl-accepting chemotaxis protein [Bryobacteraceae bacterium]|nr:HAMP domain-containing methyl-accepting chemotaxis protein [Bryobacteraceae bacterium]
MPSNSSASSALANFSIGRKLGLVLGLMIVPAFVLGVLFIHARNEQINAAKAEVGGVEYISALRSLLEAIPQHRNMTNAALNGDSTERSRAEQLQTGIDRSIQAVETVNSRFPQFGASDRVNSLKRGWGEIKGGALRLGVKESIEQHNRLVGELVEIVRQVADKSNLIFDPDLDSYYLMDAAVNQLPVITDRISRLGYLAGNAIVRKSAEDRLQAQVLSDNVDSLIQGMQRNLGVAVSVNASLDGRVNNLSVAAARGADPWLRPLRGGNVEAFGAMDRAMQGATAATSPFFTLYDAVLGNLKTLVEARIDRLNRETYTQLTCGMLVVLLVVLAGWHISRAITGQIRQINDSFALIGSGNFDVRVPVTSKDELGHMAESMNAVLDNTLSLIQSRDERNRIQQSIQKLLDDISGVAAGDLTQEAEVTAEVTGAIADSFNFMIVELRQIVKNVHQTTSNVGESAKNVLKTTEELAKGSEGQAKQIADATGSIDHMVKSIRDVSSSAGQAKSVAEHTFQKAKQGSEAVQKTIQGMGGIRNQVQETSKRLKGLGERSQEIGSIVQLIGDIADRTSILALNASIQAAMAGEAGRGFAVVAEEVERLAERAAEATKKVSTLIKSIQADTSEAITAMEETTREVVDGSNLANAAGRMLSEIESVSSQLTNLIQNISSASEEHAMGSEYISKTMSGISTHTQDTAAGAKNAAQSVQQLAGLADELRRSMQRFRLPADEVTYSRN